MRLFIAIEIEEEARRQLAEARRRFRHVNVKVSWVAPDNYHLTLKFLGETPAESVPRIEAAMEATAADMSPLQCELRGLGQFPRVIWAGLHGDTQRLGALANQLDAALGALGFPREERPFQSHLTIGRIKFAGDREGLTRGIASLTTQAFGAVRVEAIHLMQSQLTPHGPVYTKLFTASLKGTRHGHQN